MKTSDSPTVSRRRFITGTGALLGTAVLLGPASVSAAERVVETAEVTPTEDLMQEHGVLRRLLLIYGGLWPAGCKKAGKRLLRCSRRPQA